MPEIILTVLGSPKALKRHRTVRVGKHKQTTVNYDPSAGDKKDFLAIVQHKAPKKLITGPVSLMVCCYFPRPKGHYGTGRNANVLKERYKIDERYTKTPDGDNLLKFIADSLNGIFWSDDRQIWKVEVRKRYGERPRTEIEIGYDDQREER